MTQAMTPLSVAELERMTKETPAVLELMRTVPGVPPSC